MADKKAAPAEEEFAKPEVPDVAEEVAEAPKERVYFKRIVRDENGRRVERGYAEV